MRAPQLFSLIGALLIATVFASCGKYENGPGISFRSRMNRVTGDWTMKDAELDGQNVTAFYQVFKLAITKENYTETIGFPFLTPSIRTGTWEFIRNDEAIRITYNNGDVIEVEIKRLTHKEFWVEFEVTSFLNGEQVIALIRFTKD